MGDEGERVGGVVGRSGGFGGYTDMNRHNYWGVIFIAYFVANTIRLVILVIIYLSVDYRVPCMTNPGYRAGTVLEL